MAEEKAEKIQSELFRDLCKEITDQDFDSIKGALRQKTYGGFGAGQIQREITKPEKLFEHFQRKGLIKLGKYTLLRKMFRELELLNLCDVIYRAENSLRAMHWPVDSDPAAPEEARMGAGAYPQPGAPAMPGHYHIAPSYDQRGYPPQYGASPLQPQRYAGPRDKYQQQGSLAYQQSLGGYGAWEHQNYDPRYSAPQERMPSQPPQQASSLHLDHRTPPPNLVSMADTARSKSFERDDVFVPPQNPLPQHPPHDDVIFYESGRGYVLFINNFFSGKPDQRKGAEADESNIKNLFQACLSDYYLQYAKDVTKRELEGYLSSLKTTLGTGQYKSFILILGTHGQPKTAGDRKKDAVLMADNEWMVVDEIVANFHGHNIPAMKDKPKIFIIQSCRGKELQKSVSISDSPAELSSQPYEYPAPSPMLLTRPVNSDVLIAYATTEGTKAWRNEDEGSWFVWELCDVVRHFHNQEHILDLLVRVNSRMVWRESTEERAKQMPCFICTFTRRFMFHRQHLPLPQQPGV